MPKLLIPPEERTELIGKKFTKLTVTSFAYYNDKNRDFWNCICECGNEKIIRGASLKAGNTKSCGCLIKEKNRTSPKRRKDLTGQRFGKLVVIEIVTTLKNDVIWRCKCDCGGEKNVRRSKLVCGYTKSCGCLASEISSWKIHGKTKHSLHKKWISMRRRCEDEKHGSFYELYGGRGIKVYDDWHGPEGFVRFFDYCYSIHPDLDQLLVQKYELDRIDTNGNYEPGNIRFVTKTENMRNRRNSIFVSFRGEQRRLSDLSEEFNMNHKLVASRIERGWEVERALTTPKLPRHGGKQSG